jgi:peptidoglycan/xylan/chitin deacetylase (PgdA/CDA1 family)
LSEGFGNVLLEAMSFGLPVVSRYLDGVTDAFIEDGRTGYLFSHPEQFRTAVVALTDDPQLRRKLGGAARQTVEERFQIGTIAAHYTALYREVAGDARSEPSEAATTAITLRGCASVGQGPAALGFRAVDVSPGPPVLMAVIDTESEFDWSKGVAADRGTVRSIERLESVQRIFEKFGLRPCYVVDYPVVTGATSSRIMREMVARGAEIGAHLQPWTTPPFVEPIDNRHAFPGNLPEWLERQKLRVLRNAIENSLGVRPRVYKAGRYGISASTLRLLEEFGFDVDLSVAPGFNYAAERGPDFTRFESGLYAFGSARRLLEIPTTSGFVGPLSFGGSRCWSAINSGTLRWTHLPGILDRAHLFSRVRLSPEGYDQERMRKFTAALLKRRCRYFTLSFHSSSLQPGYTPYSKTEEQVTQLLRRIEDYLSFFRDEIGGVPGSPLGAFASEIRQTERPASAPSAAAA